MDRKKWSAIERLVTEQPEKAKDLLFQACDDTEVLVDVFATLSHAPANHHGHDHFNRPESSRQVHDYGERPGSRASEPSHALQKVARQYPPAMGQVPLSPPRTTSSVKSVSVKDDGTAAENILLLIPTEQGDIQYRPIGMRTAPIQCSVIRQKAIHERNLTGSLEELVDDFHVTVPRNADFESFINVPVTESISLTWRRPRSNSTHVTNFYVVPTHVLDTDIVIGTRDAGEAATDHSKYLNQMQRQQEYVAGGFGQHMYPAAPEPPTSRSVHQSAMHDDSSTRSTVRQPAHYHPRQHPPVQVGTVEEAVFANIQRQSSRSNAGSSGHISEVDPNRPADRLRLKIELGGGATAVQIWVDLAGPCDAFYKEFCKQVEKRGISVERDSASIVVRKNKEVANKEAYWIQLDEGTLEADWNDTVQYLETHRADTTPHLIGLLEIEDD